MEIAEAVARIGKFAEGYNLVVADAMRAELAQVIALARGKYFHVGGRRGPGHIVSRTGRLAKSFEHTVKFRGDEIVGEIRNPTPYAQYVFKGTAPHLIQAVRAKYLRWFDEGGDIHFPKVVHHPGTDPRPVIEWAAEEREGEMAKGIAKALVEEWTRRVG